MATEPAKISKILPLFLTLLLIVQLLAGVFLVLIPAKEVKAITGWPSGYAYQVRIPVNATATGAQTDYQMQIVLHSGSGDNTAGDIYLNGNLQDTTNFNDIRFTASDGTTLKDFWIEKVEDETSGRKATVYVELDTPASGTTDYYLYYGKASGTPASNYDNVFIKDYGESGLVGLWHTNNSPGSELLTDGGLETWSSSTDLTSWTENGTSTGVREITQESTEKYAGLYSAKLSAIGSDGTTDFGINQDITMVSNEKYQVNFYQKYSSRTQGTLKIEAYDNTNSVSLGSQSITATSTSFSFVSFRFTSTSTTNVRIKIYLNDETTGTAYIDALSVKQSSATLTDSSGNSNNGTIYGASRTDTDGGQWDGRSEVRFSTGSALQFDRRDDYVQIPDNDSLDLTNTGTIAMWAYINSYQSGKYPSLLQKGTSLGWSAGRYFIWQYSTDYIYGTIHDGDGGDNVSFGKPSAGQWHHLVFTWDGTTLLSYVDGTNINSASQTRNASADSAPIYIGRAGTTTFFDGTIDDVRIYSRVLSADEISRHYIRSKYASPAPDWATPGNQESYALSVITQSATYIGLTSATLNGYLDGFGGDSSADVYFKWGLSSDNLDQTTASSTLTDYGSSSKEISDLSSDTTYYFQTFVENSSETAQGSILSFKTVVLETDHYGVIINTDGSLTFTNKDTAATILSSAPSVSFSYLGRGTVINGNNLDSTLSVDGDFITITTVDDTNSYAQITHQYELNTDFPYINYTATFEYKQDVYVTEERFDFVVPSQNAQVMTRDLQLTSFNASNTYWSDIYTPKVVKFTNGLSFLGSDTMESMRLRTSGSNSQISFYSDYGENHPHFYYIKGGGGTSTSVNETQRSAGDTYSASVNFAINASESLQYLIKTRQPYGYDAVLTLTSHPDSWSINAAKAVAYGSQNQDDWDGVKGIVSRGIGWTHGTFKDEQWYSLEYSGTAVKDFTDQMYQNGVEIIPHSIMPSTETPEVVESGLETFAQYNSRNWIDHSASGGVNNFEDLASQGAIKGDNNYILDLLDQYNYQYAWSYIDLSTDNYALNILRPNASSDIKPFLFYNNRVDDNLNDNKKIYLWSTINTGKKLDLYYTNGHVDSLISERGIHISHEYFGHDSCENHAWYDNSGTIEIYPTFDSQLEYIAGKRTDGLLWSPTMADFGDYLVPLRDVLVTYNSDGTITVTNNSLVDVTGITLLAENNIQSVTIDNYDLVSFGGSYGVKEIVLPTLASGASVVLNIIYGTKAASTPIIASNDTSKNKVNEITGYWDSTTKTLIMTAEARTGSRSFTVTIPSLANKTIVVKDITSNTDIGEYDASADGAITFSGTLGSIHTFSLTEKPTAPTIGTPTGLSAISIRWNFTDNADNETGFKLYDNNDNLVSTNATVDLSYIDETGLSENTQYTDRYVKAYNAYGNSSSSATSTAIYTLADTPTNLTLTAQSTTQIDVSVDAFPNHSSGQSGYYFANTTASTNSGWQTGDNTWSETTLSPNTQYTYTVKYRNGDGTETSAIQSSKYTLIQSPTSASWGSITTSSIALSAAGTLSNLASSSSGLYFENSTASTHSDWIQTNFWTSASLSENTVYAFQITSRNGDGTANSAVSVGTKYTLADAPTNLTSIDASTETINLSVESFPNATSGFSGYYFYRADDETNHNSGWIQTNSWQDSGLNCSANYTYTVKYRNGDGVETDTISLIASTGSCGTMVMLPQLSAPVPTPAPEKVIGEEAAEEVKVSVSELSVEVTIQQIKAQIIIIQQRIIELIKQLIQLIQERINQLQAQVM